MIQKGNVERKALRTHPPPKKVHFSRDEFTGLPAFSLTLFFCILCMCLLLFESAALFPNVLFSPLVEQFCCPFYLETVREREKKKK